MPIWNFRKKNETPDEPEVEASPQEILDAIDLDDFLAAGPYLAEDPSRTASGLHPHEVLILYFAASLYTDQEDFPTFWRRDYGILQMPKLLASLVERDFLTEAPIEQTLEAATVPALKAALKKSGKPVGGKKTELIERLLTTVPEGELYALFPRRTFALTAAGVRAIDEAMHIPYLHKYPVEGMTLWTLHREVAQRPEQSYRDLIWTHLETRSLSHLQAGAYDAYRACRYRMYQFQMEDNKLKRAFPLLAEVIYYDLSGSVGGLDPLFRYVSEKYFFPYDKSIVRLSATSVQAMARLKADLDLSEEMLRALLMQFFGQLSVPFHLFTIKECAVIVLLELRGDIDLLREVYKMAETRFGQPD